MPEWKRVAKIVAVVIAILLILGVFISFFIPNSPTTKYILQLMEYLKTINKLYAGLIFTMAYIVALLLILPGTPLNLAAGYIFGVWIGCLLTVFSCTFGALTSFALGRYVVRRWAEKMMEDSPKFKAIDRALSSKGFLLIFLTRLSPILPFGLCNYLFGVTSIRFGVYIGSSFLGLMPGTIAYTYLGTLMKNLSEIYSQNLGKGQIAVIIVGIILTIVIIVVISIVSKREIDKALKEEEMKQIELDNLGQLNENGNEGEVAIDLKKVDSGADSNEEIRMDDLLKSPEDGSEDEDSHDKSLDSPYLKKLFESSINTNKSIGNLIVYKNSELNRSLSNLNIYKDFEKKKESLSPHNSSSDDNNKNNNKITITVSASDDDDQINEQVDGKNNSEIIDLDNLKNEENEDGGNYGDEKSPHNSNNNPVLAAFGSTESLNFAELTFGDNIPCVDNPTPRLSHPHLNRTNNMNSINNFYNNLNESNNNNDEVVEFFNKNFNSNSNNKDVTPPGSSGGVRISPRNTLSPPSSNNSSGNSSSSTRISPRSFSHSDLFNNNNHNHTSIHNSNSNNNIVHNNSYSNISYSNYNSNERNGKNNNISNNGYNSNERNEMNNNDTTSSSSSLPISKSPSRSNSHNNFLNNSNNNINNSNNSNSNNNIVYNNNSNNNNNNNNNFNNNNNNTINEKKITPPNSNSNSNKLSPPNSNPSPRNSKKNSQNNLIKIEEEEEDNDDDNTSHRDSPFKFNSDQKDFGEDDEDEDIDYNSKNKKTRRKIEKRPLVNKDSK